MTPTELLNRAIAEVRAMYEDGDLGTGPVGRLLIALGAAPHTPCDPAEDDTLGEEDDEDLTWTDIEGIVWDLRRSFRDDDGVEWQWAGGWEWAPDKQPLLSRGDWSECDIPFSYVDAARGPLAQETP